MDYQCMKKKNYEMEINCWEKSISNIDELESNNNIF